jgi:hypothetical protein
VCVQLQLQLNQDLSSFFTQEDSSSKSNKRGVLPKSATNIMRTWLFQHIGVSEKHLVSTVPKIRITSTITECNVTQSKALLGYSKGV